MTPWGYIQCPQCKHLFLNVGMDRVCLQTHLLYECSMRIITCPDCKQEKPLTHACPNKPCEASMFCDGVGVLHSEACQTAICFRQLSQTHKAKQVRSSISIAILCSILFLAFIILQVKSRKIAVLTEQIAIFTGHARAILRETL